MASPGPGSRVAGYLIEAKIGQGGMGTVFYAHHEATGQTVALKVISVDMADDPGLRDRFLREARELDVLRHPHVIPVHHAGNADGVLYIATRYVPSGDLATLLRRNGGPLPAVRAAALIEQVASALDMAHAAGRVHRDVKPGNILVEVVPGSRDHAYLSDFGLIKVMAATTLTVTGTVAGGTPSYEAPEQVLSSEVDGRADQYSLACVAFELLTGQVPYPRPSASLVYEAHRIAPVPSVSAINPLVPPAVDQVLRQAMAKLPGGRYGSCGEFAADLRGAVTPPAYTPTVSVGQDRTVTTGPPPGPTPRPVPGPPTPTWRPEPARQRRPVPGRRTVVAAAAVVVGLLAAILFVPGLVHAGGTGTTGGTGAAGASAVSGNASLRWSYVTGINIDASNVATAGSSPVAVDGTVYAGGNNGDVYAFNAATGHVDWHYVSPPGESGLTVAGGTVYVGSAGGMYALSAATGHVRWSYGSGSAGSGPVVADGTVYIVDASGNVHALNAATGHVDWSHSITYAGTGLSVANGLVYVSSIGDIGYVYALNAATGDLAWSFKTLDARESVPTVVDGIVYVGCGNGMGSNGTVFALDAATGKLRWSFTTGLAGNVQPPVESSPAVANGTVYVGSDYGAVYALDAATGHLRWSSLTQGGVVSSPVVAGNVVYVGSEDDNVYALDTVTGHLVWSYHTGDIVVASPAVAGGIAYAASDDGKLYALATVK